MKVLSLFACLALVTAHATDDVPSISTGQRVATCGHSFHVFTYKQVEQIAASAGLKHQLAGI